MTLSTLIGKVEYLLIGIPLNTFIFRAYIASTFSNDSEVKEAQRLLQGYTKDEKTPLGRMYFLI